MLRRPHTSNSSFLDKIHAPAWLVLILAITFILRIPSFFEPFYYGDEMIYLNLGEAIKRGMVLYRDIHDNKPPLLYFLAGLAGNVFWFRAILAGWMLITIMLFWRLSEVIFPKDRLIVKTSVSVFAILTTIPLLEGHIANAEVFMLAPTIAAFLILLTQKLNSKNLLLAGVLFSISTLFKIPAAFDFAAAVVFWGITIKLRKKEVVSYLKATFILSIGFFLPIILTMIWYYLRGALGEYITAAYLQNIGYLSSFRPEDVQDSFLVRNGPLLVRGGVLVAGISILYFLRKRLSKEFILIVVWLLFSLFAVTLSERPYPHYLIQLVPTVSLLIGVLVARQTTEQSLSLLPLFLVVLAIIRFQFWYYPTLPYYQRFMNYATGQISKEEYFNKFDKNTTRNYKVAEFLVTSSRSEDKIFIWGDASPIYALSRRLPPIKYVATYHIIDFSSQEEIMGKLTKNRPRFIIYLPDSPAFPMLTNYLQNGYLLIEDIEGAKVYKSINFLIP